MKRLSLPMLISVAAHAALLILLSGVLAHIGRNDDRPLSGGGGSGFVFVEIVGEGGEGGKPDIVRDAPKEDAAIKFPKKASEKETKRPGSPSAVLTGPGAGAGEPGPGSGPAGGTSTILAEIRSRIEKAKRYPILLRQSGVQGIAHVGFRIDTAGQPEGVTLKTSSGSPALDEEALATIRRAAPYPLYGDSLNIGIRFELRD